MIDHEHFLMSKNVLLLHDFSNCIIGYTRRYLITVKFQESENGGEYFKFIVTFSSCFIAHLLCAMLPHKAIFIFITTFNLHRVPMTTYEALR